MYWIIGSLQSAVIRALRLFYSGYAIFNMHRKCWLKYWLCYETCYCRRTDKNRSVNHWNDKTEREISRNCSILPTSRYTKTWMYCGCKEFFWNTLPLEESTQMMNFTLLGNRGFGEDINKWIPTVCILLSIIKTSCGIKFGYVLLLCSTH